jgi:hypothetical protein
MVFLLLLGVQSCLFGSPQNGQVMSDDEAARIAEAAFLDATKHRVTDYSKHKCRAQRSDERCFIFSGEGKFDRPGQDWAVLVDVRTGKVEVLPGQ